MHRHAKTIFTLTLGLLAAAAAEQRGAKAKVCPYCQNDPELLARAGLVSHGPVDIGPAGGSEALANSLAVSDWLFLESEQSPVLKQETEWDTDDLKVAVRHCVAAKAVDYRGLYKDVTGNRTVASLGAVIAAMQVQTEPSGAYINVRPSYVLCGPTDEVALGQLISSGVDPAKYNGVPNPFQNKLTVVVSPHLA